MKRLLGRISAEGIRQDSTFVCNICAASCFVPLEELDREVVSCSACGSTPRFRAVVSVLSQELFGTQLPLPDFPRRTDLVGLGMSDWAGYARPLARRLSYTNTFLDRSPRLDVTQPHPQFGGTFDFIVASEVFEHVVAPVEKAFANTLEMLKPGGFLLLTVPFTLGARNKEHYPDLFDYQLMDFNGEKVLVNRTATGRWEVFEKPVFHGGEGLTLEMRVFCRDGLVHSLMQAGFGDIRFVGGAPEFGARWPEPYSLPVVARKLPAGR